MFEVLGVPSVFSPVHLMGKWEAAAAGIGWLREEVGADGMSHLPQ